MELWTALTLGLLGSVHCMGMCGPIAVSIPGNDDSVVRSFIRSVIYNLGRVLTYALFGLVFGILGMGATLAGYQNILSVMLGVLIILFAVFPKLKPNLSENHLYRIFSDFLSKTIGKLFSNRSYSSSFLIGSLNGFLPCGFVITALAAALITTSPFHSSVYMVLFGIGTIPVMLFMNMAPMILKPSIRTRLRPLSTYFAIFLGSFLIYRGIMVGNMISHGM
ncbi:sulfite exporter TauE/SafE family protein [Balneola sp. MJW-20]|uniref:sulfite exporter TauE/SafE family protein n=1 Tax=Gracilimonas aurantiaca TaxID=3234185 RepID=UPI003465A8AD